MTTSFSITGKLHLERDEQTVFVLTEFPIKWANGVNMTIHDIWTRLEFGKEYELIIKEKPQ